MAATMQRVFQVNITAVLPEPRSRISGLMQAVSLSLALMSPASVPPAAFELPAAVIPVSGDLKMRFTG